MKLNENSLASTIANREGKKQEVNVAQIKEVLKITLEELARVPASVALALIEKHAPAPNEAKAQEATTFLAGGVRINEPRDMIVGKPLVKLNHPPEKPGNSTTLPKSAWIK
jgi:hypothetical protein